MRQQGHRSRQQAQRRGGADGGGQIQRDELQAGREPANRVRQNHMQRRDHVRAPVPSGGFHQRGDAAKSRRVIEGNDVNQQRARRDEPRQTALRKSHFHFWLRLHFRLSAAS